MLRRNDVCPQRPERMHNAAARLVGPGGMSYGPGGVGYGPGGMGYGPGGMG